MKQILLVIMLCSTFAVNCQIYPVFGSPIDVSITGLSFDAMEPFISANGNYLFFNNLNDGINTKLFYATRLNDSVFNFVGELNGTNQPTPPHLDAVADMDALNNFYWTSTRNYPVDLDNLFHGTFANGTVSNIGRVQGSFYKNIPGWLIMDHGISTDGQYLYYNNARFDGICQGPCETELGIAQKVNDSTFNKIPNSDLLLHAVMDTNFIYYAPCISSDQLELYYTRYPKGAITPSTLFEICVAVRNSPNDTFSAPHVLFSELIADLIEAPTLSTDMQRMYYHRKTATSHKIVLRYRQAASTIFAASDSEFSLLLYPNPAKGIVSIQTPFKYTSLDISVCNLLGAPLLTGLHQTEIDIRSLAPGIYFVRIELDKQTVINRMLRIE
ncbi:MAG: T9SS type A sorting domain-containing protein [Bacteroidetes bacterium]|nr:T9SS type A sorting domain-containing protein [Bacteroidota bacterium]MBK8145185.1 T9SS type A sorting domain-containing protein [Bacteroidota bacterium]MBP6316177.1 T9SS type A sorting domain-containing protein [Chitinophagaceae bacterium]